MPKQNELQKPKEGVIRIGTGSDQEKPSFRKRHNKKPTNNLALARQEVRSTRRQSKKVSNLLRKEIRQHSSQIVGTGRGSLPAQIALSLALPVEHAPQRYANEYSVKQTGVSNPDDLIEPVGYNADSSTFAFMFRSQARQSVVLTQASGAVKYNALIIPNDSSDLNPHGAVPLQNANLIVPIDSDVNVKIAYWVPDATSVSNVHGPVLYSGSDSPANERRFFWAEVGQVLTAAYNATTGTGAFVPMLDYWNPDGVHKDAQEGTPCAAGSTGFNFTIANQGYYSLRLVNIKTTTDASVNLVSCSLKLTGGAGLYAAHLSAVTFFQNVPSETNYRILGYALKWTNQEPILNRGADVIACQIPKGLYWGQLQPTSGQPPAWSGFNGKGILENTKGIYIFAKPTGAEDFALKSEVVCFGTTVMDSHYALYNEHDFVAVWAKHSQATGIASRWCRYMALEYETTDPRRNTNSARASAAEYRMGLEILKHVPQIHSNEDHVKEITSKIHSVLSTIFNGVQKVGPYVLGGLKAFGELL